jgi:hypothetical protein
MQMRPTAAPAALQLLSPPQSEPLPSSSLHFRSVLQERGQSRVQTGVRSRVGGTVRLETRTLAHVTTSYGARSSTQRTGTLVRA